MPGPTQQHWGPEELCARPATALTRSSGSGLQPPAESRGRPQGCGTVLHSLFLTFTDFASTLQPRSASYLPPLLDSDSFKTPLNPKVLLSTTVWYCG